MKKRISVCIPTYNRPQLFEEALESVLEQEPKPFEVLVGDDSINKKTEQLVRKYQEEGVPIRYFKNDPSLGQAKNVDKLFKEVKGDYLILLHDDKLLKGALKKLLECFKKHDDIVAAFGKQQIINENGDINWEATEGLNKDYYRTQEYEGKQPSILRSAITQQFPNNGYMVKVGAAKKVGYDIPNSCDAIDFAFGFELARQSDERFYYTDIYTAQYRLSNESIGRGESMGDAGYYSYKMVVTSAEQDLLDDPHVDEWLCKRSPVAIMIAAQKGYLNDGLRWFFGIYHRPHILSLGGINRFLT